MLEVVNSATDAKFNTANRLLHQLKSISSIGVSQLPVLVVGDPDGLQAVGDLLAGPGSRYRVAAAIEADHLLAAPAGPHWAQVLRQAGAGRVLLAPDLSAHVLRRLIRSLDRDCIRFGVLRGEALDRGAAAPFADPILWRGADWRETLRNTAKTALDVCLASLLLLCLSPMLLLVAFLVRLDGGPVLFAHERIGANGRRFRCLKFRTMVVNSDAVLRDLLAHDKQAAAQWAKDHKLQKDPRVTRIGRFLRASSLDELPQLVNVLRLEMSLVGPRPIVEAEVQKYKENINFYYKVRPGLTGLWQVSGRSDTSYERRVALDTWYVKNWSLWFDVAILLRTFPAMLGGKGAR